MKLFPTFATLVALVSIAAASRQQIFSEHPLMSTSESDSDSLNLEAFVDQYKDPVEAMKAYDPSSAYELDQPRLIEVFGELEPVWMTEGDKLCLRKNGKAFMDVTEFRDIKRKDRFTASSESSWPELQHKDKVKHVISRLNIDNLNITITKLTSFWNRYYKLEHGRESSHWLYTQILDIIAHAPSSPALSIEKVTNWFPQSSIIARFEPATGRNASAPVFIIGAHLDSANYRFPLLRAPGADDDGSGTIAILEAFRELVATGFNPKYPVEFHWYAAEEGGLLGSQEIVKDYVAKNVNVGAMIQFDMVAYVEKGTTPKFTLISTDVDNSLTNYTEKLAKAYISEDVQQAKLFSGAGSDHVSWHKAGFPSTCATEGNPLAGDFDPYIHTGQDRADIPEYSLEHALEASKVAVAFAIELGKWEGKLNKAP